MKKTRIKKSMSFIISIVLVFSMLGGCTQAESKAVVSQEFEIETQFESSAKEVGCTL